MCRILSCYITFRTNSVSLIGLEKEITSLLGIEKFECYRHPTSQKQFQASQTNNLSPRIINYYRCL